MASYSGSPLQRRFLDAIASGEATGYDMLYGGGRFGSYADHPRQSIPIQSGPNAGKTSSAAGRYQFLAPTWDEVSKELGLKDFSPESQDQAAWYLAAKTYQQKTGRDLLGDLQSGNTKDIGQALSGVWTSLPGGIEPNKATGNFAAMLGGGGSPQAVAAAQPAMPMQAQSSPMGVLSGLGQQATGLLGGGMGSPSGILAMLGGQPKQQMQAPPLIDEPQRPIDLSGLQALLRPANRRVFL